MGISPQFRSEADWKNPVFLESWKATRRRELEQVWADRWQPLFHGPRALARDLKLEQDLARYIGETLQEGESLTDRARRLEGKQKFRRRRRIGYEVPNLIGRTDSGEWILAPAARRATAETIAECKKLFELGLEKKAQRQLACGTLGGEVVCTSGHRFLAGYQCGNRYCVRCGPRGANKLFAKQLDKLFRVSAGLLACSRPGCDCQSERDPSKLPHWPPIRGIRPRVVVAKIDFTLINTGEQPGPDLMRWLNLCIKRFCRAFERKWKIRRREYGLAYCDELGGNNTNAHAHGIYVGPWLPQTKGICELSQLWAKVTGYNRKRPTAGSPGGFIVSIKYSRNFSMALHHAVKYPAKFAERSTPERRAILEATFHRVRRFHTLGAFYAPRIPEDPPAGRRCPICNERLSEPKQWRAIWDLEREGLRDVSEIAREISRARAFHGPAPP